MGKSNWESHLYTERINPSRPFWIMFTLSEYHSKWWTWVYNPIAKKHLICLTWTYSLEIIQIFWKCVQQFRIWYKLGNRRQGFLSLSPNLTDSLFHVVIMEYILELSLKNSILSVQGWSLNTTFTTPLYALHQWQEKN